MIRLFEKDPKIIIITITRSPKGFQVNTRREDEGFRCAQQFHPTIEAAIGEHLPKQSTDLGDLLG